MKNHLVVVAEQQVQEQPQDQVRPRQRRDQHRPFRDPEQQGPIRRGRDSPPRALPKRLWQVAAL